MNTISILLIIWKFYDITVYKYLMYSLRLKINIFLGSVKVKSNFFSKFFLKYFHKIICNNFIIKESSNYLLQVTLYNSKIIFVLFYILFSEKHVDFDQAQKEFILGGRE